MTRECRTIATLVVMILIGAAALGVPANAMERDAAGPRGGLLFFATYPYRDNTDAVNNPHLVGALITIYWSRIEAQDGVYDWSTVDGWIKPWTEAGKKVALRIMWSSSGRWQDPAAAQPTPQWVLSQGAAVAFAKGSRTQAPLQWDPIYKRYADRFLREVARKFDGDPNVLFLDVTPGAETNPYRGGMNRREPDFKQTFRDTAASDGRKYSDELWLETVKLYVATAAKTLTKTRLLVTLNRGSLEGRSQFAEISQYCVTHGMMVGQNGLNGNSYLRDSPRRRLFLEQGTRMGLYFEMVHPSGSSTGTLMEVMKAAERIRCDYLGVYPADVLKGTSGHGTYDPDYEKALQFGASVVGHRDPETNNDIESIKLQEPAKGNQL